MSELLSQVDILTWEAYQNEGNIGSILGKVYDPAGAITYDIETSTLHPTPDQLQWLLDRLDELSNTLKDRGALHISDLEDKDYNRSLKLKGGMGYTKRFLD